MGAFKEAYMAEKNYITEMKDDGWVLDDKDLDYDNPVEEQEEQEDCCYTATDVMDDGEINERLFKKIVVRAGKKIKKWFSTDKNKKVVPGKDGGKPKEVVKKAKEKIARKKGALKGKIKRKVKGAQSKIKARLSRLKRNIFGIKRAKK